MDIDEDKLTLDENQLEELVEQQLKNEMRSDPSFKPPERDLPETGLHKLRMGN
jgi:hypothetical protein